VLLLLPLLVLLPRVARAVAGRMTVVLLALLVAVAPPPRRRHCATRRG
jgi:hypothetical protein